MRRAWRWRHLSLYGTFRLGRPSSGTHGPHSPGFLQAARGSFGITFFVRDTDVPLTLFLFSRGTGVATLRDSVISYGGLLPVLFNVSAGALFFGSPFRFPSLRCPLHLRFSVFRRRPFPGRQGAVLSLRLPESALQVFGSFLTFSLAEGPNRRLRPKRRFAESMADRDRYGCWQVGSLWLGRPLSPLNMLVATSCALFSGTSFRSFPRIRGLTPRLPGDGREPPAHSISGNDSTNFRGVVGITVATRVYPLLTRGPEKDRAGMPSILRRPATDSTFGDPAGAGFGDVV